ncbi:unnamed protein product [Blepharisma stoltei]|uniref:Uncharacterized protein n=1 Tax=Blepharisma stoltei TaxID=1481888 RepID=A0AAU9J1I8_9CILI|nr:unnamed protein product [Blepharisma stoltei]
MEGEEYHQQLANALQLSLNAKDNSQLGAIIQQLIESRTQLQISFSYKCSYHQYLNLPDQQSLFSSRENANNLLCQYNHMSCTQCTQVYVRKCVLQNGLESPIYCPICESYGIKELTPLLVSDEVKKLALSQ